jgi:hypothetical protein
VKIKETLNPRNYLINLQGLHLDLETLTCKTNNYKKGKVLWLDDITLRHWAIILPIASLSINDQV